MDNMFISKLIIELNKRDDWSIEELYMIRRRILEEAFDMFMYMTQNPLLYNPEFSDLFSDSLSNISCSISAFIRKMREESIYGNNNEFVLLECIKALEKPRIKFQNDIKNVNYEKIDSLIYSSICTGFVDEKFSDKDFFRLCEKIINRNL